MTYRVIWEVDIDDADDPEEAARRALAIQRNPDVVAANFVVIDRDTGALWLVDLDSKPTKRVI